MSMNVSECHDRVNFGLLQSYFGLIGPVVLSVACSGEFASREEQDENLGG
jgi:hypothetical protein